MIQEVPTLRGGGGQIATLGGGAGATRGAVSSRDGVIGSWTAREATGGSCRISLSSAPALDLYRANAAGCANKDLQKVNAWDYRNGEVYLYQQGGTVVARLRAERWRLDERRRDEIRRLAVAQPLSIAQAGAVKIATVASHPADQTSERCVGQSAT